MFIKSLGTNFREISIQMQYLSLENLACIRKLSAKPKCEPFCLGLNMLPWSHSKLGHLWVSQSFHRFHIESIPGIIQGMGSANERCRYMVTASPIAWANTQNDPWIPSLWTISTHMDVNTLRSRKNGCHFADIIFLLFIHIIYFIFILFIKAVLSLFKYHWNLLPKVQTPTCKQWFR